MNADEKRVEILRMISATAVMSLGASLAIGSIIVAVAVWLQ